MITSGRLTAGIEPTDKQLYHAVYGSSSVPEEEVVRYPEHGPLRMSEIRLSGSIGTRLSMAPWGRT